MILKTYIDTTHQKVLNSVILVVRLKTITVLTLYPFNQEKQNHQLFLLGKDKDKYKKALKARMSLMVKRIN